MLYLYAFKKIGYKIVHLTLSLITTDGILIFFVSFTSPEDLEAFPNFLNDWHLNILFTIENENQNRVSFLDVQITHEDETSTTSVYHKPTFSGVYTYFDSFLPSTYKFDTVYTFWICSSPTKLHTELLSLKHIFLKNGYHENFVN